jgi:hypothetical protein
MDARVEHLVATGILGGRYGQDRIFRIDGKATATDPASERYAISGPSVIRPPLRPIQGAASTSLDLSTRMRSSCGSCPQPQGAKWGKAGQVVPNSSLGRGSSLSKVGVAQRFRCGNSKRGWNKSPGRRTDRGCAGRRWGERGARPARCKKAYRRLIVPGARVLSQRRLIAKL